MYIATAELVGVSPLGFSRAIKSIKKSKEAHDEFEERTWRERAHVDENGEVFINPMSLKNALSWMAKYMGESIPGKGKSTFTKHFEAGCNVVELLRLGVKVADLGCERLFVPSDGKKGGGKRVWKNFPRLDKWSCKAEIIVIDPFIKPDKLEEYLGFAGKLCGLGFFRPQVGGYWGRFNVKDFTVK